MAIPTAIKYFLYIEAILFGPFSLHHYLSFTDRKQLKHLTNNRVACAAGAARRARRAAARCARPPRRRWMIIHSGEMLNGVRDPRPSRAPRDRAPTARRFRRSARGSSCSSCSTASSTTRSRS